MVDASKEEALLAVDLYNQPKQPRRLEAFFVHMHLAWLYLLHARFRHDKVDYRYRKRNGQFERVDGEPKTWELAKCVAERWGDNDAVRKNLGLYPRSSKQDRTSILGGHRPRHQWLHPSAPSELRGGANENLRRITLTCRSTAFPRFHWHVHAGGSTTARESPEGGPEEGK